MTRANEQATCARVVGTKRNVSYIAKPVYSRGAHRLPIRMCERVCREALSFSLSLSLSMIVCLWRYRGAHRASGMHFPARASARARIRSRTLFLSLFLSTAVCRWRRVACNLAISVATLKPSASHRCTHARFCRDKSCEWASFSCSLPLFLCGASANFRFLAFARCFGSLPFAHISHTHIYKCTCPLQYCGDKDIPRRFGCEQRERRVIARERAIITLSGWRLHSCAGHFII